ncbi:hypothetical protein PMAYCL1PPCAC_10842, partial [Pristionchus mayeri]
PARNGFPTHQPYQKPAVTYLPHCALHNPQRGTAFRQTINPATDVLMRRMRRLPGFKDIPDSLLYGLLAGSTGAADKVQEGVTLFDQGERTGFWYLLLSGQVEVYLPSRAHGLDATITLSVLSAGSLFGELEVPVHTCSARTRKASEFIRIAQASFVNLYNKNADVLHAIVVVMQDMVSEEKVPTPPLDTEYSIMNRQGFSGSIHPHPHELPFANGYERTTAVDQFGNDVEFTACDRPPHPHHEPQSIVEFTNSMGLFARLQEVGRILQREMAVTSPTMIADRVVQGRHYMDSMIGTEMVDWLLNATLKTSTTGAALSRFQVSGMWQALLEFDVIAHVSNEQYFADKQIFYKWTHPARPQREPLEDTTDELTSAIFLLSTIGPDSLFRMILAKSPSERTPEELELVYEELLHVKALAHLSTMVKRELAAVIGIETHTHAGTVIFHQGDPGACWYIILRGAVDVSIRGKGVVCTLREGDDFGKLALVNESKRAATIILRDDEAQILRDVEANTVRLKEHGQDVLVLEKVFTPRGAVVQGRQESHCTYSVMAGLAEKMLEYLLETRIDAQEEDVTSVNPTLQDFLLTHPIYMPTNILCNSLKKYYTRHPMVTTIFPSTDVVIQEDTEQILTAKRRVVTFVALWVKTLGLHYFLDPSANSFIEELYCCVLEDAQSLPGMSPVLSRMKSCREARDRVMLTLSRHSQIVLDCGVYAPTSTAPHILPIDTCRQLIRHPDGTSFVLSVKMDKRVADVIEMCRPHIRSSTNQEVLVMTEMKSNGERLVLAPNDISLPTMLSLNGKLFVSTRDEVDHLMIHDGENGPNPSGTSLLDLFGSAELATQLGFFHMELFHATNELETIAQVFGRDAFPGHIPSNLDLLLRRFNEVQYWATTEVLVAPAQKRVQSLRKLIKIAHYSKQQGDLLSLFAIVLGLSNVAVSRLTLTWEKLPSRIKRMFSELESLLDPTRNHRAYRSLIAKMQIPFVPFIPLLLKDLTFIHEGNKTFFNGLVNFEKMHMIANVIRTFKECKATSGVTGILHRDEKPESQLLVRNLRVIDDQRRLLDLSYQIEPKSSRR